MKRTFAVRLGVSAVAIGLLAGCQSTPPANTEVAPIVPVAAPATAPAPVKVKAQPTPPEVQSAQPLSSPTGPGDSLFKSDRDVLGGADLLRIRSASVHLPSTIHLAVTRMSRHDDPPTPADWVFLDTPLRNDLVKRLKGSKRVGEIVFIPSWIVADADLPHLREAAARFNADAILVFKDTCSVASLGTAPGSPIVGDCAAEAILLDARSGLVIGAWSDTGNHATTAPPRDVDPTPERAGVERQAAADAVGKVADELSGFLDNLP